MAELLQYLQGLFGDMPGLAWLQYVFYGLIILIIIDAFFNLIFSLLGALFKGK